MATFRNRCGGIQRSSDVADFLDQWTRFDQDFAYAQLVSEMDYSALAPLRQLPSLDNQCTTINFTASRP